MASAKRFSFDSWYDEGQSDPDHGEVLYTEPGDDMIDVTITCNGHTHKYIYSYEDEEEMRDVVFEQVETGKLHPYIGLMALLAMGEEE
jgi:hypothetical protein